MKATFGSTLRAYRMGYRTVEGVGFVRIHAGGPPWEVHILPFNKLAVQRDRTEHCVWWDQPDARRMIEQTIRRYVTSEATEPRVLFLDDDGNDVTSQEENA
jgi:hypothetical protein